MTQIKLGPKRYMKHAYFFGYGSLVNRDTHAFAEAHTARLSGWKRIWRHTSLRPVAYLTVVPDADSEIDGLIAAVPGDDWAALDERERAYARHDVSHAVAHDGPEAPCAVYRVSEGLIEPASGAAPILLSYLDTVAQGFLKVHGDAGLAAFFATTAGWGPIRDDRAAPVYPRAQALSAEEREAVDRHLAEVTRGG